MFDIIKSLYHGNISIERECNSIADPTLDVLKRDVEIALATLVDTLSFEQQNLLARYAVARDKLSGARDEICFTAGFRLASRLYAESFDKK